MFLSCVSFLCPVLVSLSLPFVSVVLHFRADGSAATQPLPTSDPTNCLVAHGLPGGVLYSQVDTFIHGFLRQEGVEKKMKENLEELLQAFEEMEKERDQWRTEEATSLKQIAALRTQLTNKARELKKVQANEKASLEDLRVRYLVHAAIVLLRPSYTV